MVLALAEELEDGDGEAVEGYDECSEAQEQACLHLREVGLGGEMRYLAFNAAQPLVDARQVGLGREVVLGRDRCGVHCLRDDTIASVAVNLLEIYV